MKSSTPFAENLAVVARDIGNGFFEMKDFPSICFEAVDVPIDFQTIAKKFYPLVYEKFGNKLKFSVFSF